jgi:hypothetical protein
MNQERSFSSDSLMMPKQNNEFVYFKNEEDNKIVEIKNIITKDFSKTIIEESEKIPNWRKVGFHKAEVLDQINNIPEVNETFSNYIEEYIEKSKDAFKAIYGKSVKLTYIYIQKWPVGSYAIKHNDTHNFDGSPGFIDCPLAVLLYLYNDFTGGKLEFPDHNISISPNQGSGYFFEGGPKNEHQVTIIESGLRYTIVSFWDFEDSTYNENDINALKENQQKWSQYSNINNERDS